MHSLVSAQVQLHQLGEGAPGSPAVGEEVSVQEADAIPREEVAPELVVGQVQELGGGKAAERVGGRFCSTS